MDFEDFIKIYFVDDSGFTADSINKSEALKKLAGDLARDGKKVIVIYDRISKPMKGLKEAIERFNAKKADILLYSIPKPYSKEAVVYTGTRETMKEEFKKAMQLLRESGRTFMLPINTKVDFVESKHLLEDVKKSLDRSPPQRKNPFVYSNSESWRKRRK